MVLGTARRTSKRGAQLPLATLGSGPLHVLGKLAFFLGQPRSISPKPLRKRMFGRFLPRIRCDHSAEPQIGIALSQTFGSRLVQMEKYLLEKRPAGPMMPFGRPGPPKKNFQAAGPPRIRSLAPVPARRNTIPACQR